MTTEATIQEERAALARMAQRATQRPSPGPFTPPWYHRARWTPRTNRRRYREHLDALRSQQERTRREEERAAQRRALVLDPRAGWDERVQEPDGELLREAWELLERLREPLPTLGPSNGNFPPRGAGRVTWRSYDRAAHPLEGRRTILPFGPDDAPSSGPVVVEPLVRLGQKYRAAVHELLELGRHVEARKVWECWYHCARLTFHCSGGPKDADHHHPHEWREYRGRCRSRRCPICGDRACKPTRRSSYAALGEQERALSIVVTAEGGKRGGHTPDRSAYWMNRLALKLEGLFLAAPWRPPAGPDASPDARLARAMGFRPAGLIATHYTGGRSASRGNLHAHYNVALGNRAEWMAPVTRFGYRRNGQRWTRREWQPTGIWVDLRDHGWSKRGLPESFAWPWSMFKWARAWLSGLIGNEGRGNWDVEPKIGPREIAQMVGYYIRPPGDGRPDLQARWSWAYAHQSRGFGVAAAHRRRSWRGVNPPARDYRDLVATDAGRGALDVSACPENQETSRAYVAEASGREPWIPNRALWNAMERGDARRQRREVGRLQAGHVRGSVAHWPTATRRPRDGPLIQGARGQARAGLTPESQARLDLLRRRQAKRREERAGSG